jgi:hypothetical protein
MFGITELAMHIGELTAAVRSLRLTITKQGSNISHEISELVSLLRLRKPGIVFIVVLGGDSMSRPFKLVFTAPKAKDTAKRLLAVSIGGAEPIKFDLPADTLSQDGFSGNLNDNVVGSLVDVDSSGNESEAREFEFTILDKTPPPKPDEVQFVDTSEE